MKLSEKGQYKVAEANMRIVMLPTYPPQYRAMGTKNLEFEPDDFKGVVVLTVEEAKLIVKALDCLEADVEGLDETSQSLIRSRCARHHLKERIKQAEKIK